MRTAKIPKKYQNGWRIVAETHYGLLFNRIRYPLWIKRPICWIKGHKKKVFYPYGCKIKQCVRCAMVFYKLPTNELTINPFTGEIGSLYGIRFVSTERVKSGTVTISGIHKK